MTIVDAHIHLWSTDLTQYPDIALRQTGKSELPPADGRAERIVEAMDGSGVAFALNVQVPWFREDNSYHLDAVRRFPGRFAFLAVMDLDTPGAGARYERFHHELGARGFRLHYDELDKVLDGTLDDLLQAALRLDAPVQFLGQHRHMAGIREMIRRYDGLRVIIDHLCHPNPGCAPDYTEWADYFAIGEYERAYVKVSLQVNQSKAPWPYRDLHGFTKRTIDRFTPQRCMWGSNFPLIPDTVTYDEILAVVRDHLDWLSADERASVLGGTALGLWEAS